MKLLAQRDVYGALTKENFDLQTEVERLRAALDRIAYGDRPQKAVEAYHFLRQLAREVLK